MKNKRKIRISFLKATETSDEMINSQGFLDTARKRPQDFTRNRKLPFAHLIMFMLRMIKSTIQSCLDVYFEKIGKLEFHMKQQSFSEARLKIRWEAFRDLFKAIVNLIYTGYYDTWHGYRLSAIDGTKVQIPDDQALRDHFGTMGKDNSAATAQGSALYDVLNKVTLDAQLEPLATDERTLALRHLYARCDISMHCESFLLLARSALYTTGATLLLK